MSKRHIQRHDLWSAVVSKRHDLRATVVSKRHDLWSVVVSKRHDLWSLLWPVVSKRHDLRVSARPQLGNGNHNKLKQACTPHSPDLFDEILQSH